MIYITGNSHLGAIRKGANLDSVRQHIEMFPLGSANFESDIFSTLEKGDLKFLPDSMSTRLMKATGRESLSLEHVWGFVVGTHNSPMYGHAFWKSADFLTPPAKGRPISKDALDTILNRFLAPKLHFFSQLKKINCEYFVISGPPPKRDNPCFLKGVDLETAIHLDRLLREKLEKWLHSNQITLIRPPVKTVDGDGFLKSAYSQQVIDSGKNDPHHANPAYGELMFEKVLKHIESNLASNVSRTVDVLKTA